MQLVVCEKPSVAASLAKALGVTERKNGYIEGDNIIVSWCILLSTLTALNMREAIMKCPSLRKVCRLTECVRLK